MDEKLYNAIWNFTAANSAKCPTDTEIVKELVKNQIIVPASPTDTVFMQDVFDCVRSALKYHNIIAKGEKKHEETKTVFG